jgi:hypothetical protein
MQIDQDTASSKGEAGDSDLEMEDVPMFVSPQLVALFLPTDFMYLPSYFTDLGRPCPTQINMSSTDT